MINVAVVLTASTLNLTPLPGQGEEGAQRQVTVDEEAQCAD